MLVLRHSVTILRVGLAGTIHPKLFILLVSGLAVNSVINYEFVQLSYIHL